MDILKLIIIFSMILISIKYRKPLYFSILLGTLAAIILYNINFFDALHLFKIGITSKETINLVLAFYLITFIQKLMENRGFLILAEESLSNIFQSRRVNATLAPFVIGLLPSAGAVLLAAPIVDKAAGDYLNTQEKAFVTTYYRHIPELFFPTYSSILLALNLSGVDVTGFVLAMIPLMFVLFILGHIFYVKKIPGKAKYILNSHNNSKNKDRNLKKDLKNLVKSLWGIVLVIAILLTFKIPVYLATLPIILLFILINKFNFKEILQTVKSAFEPNLIVSTVAIMIFKEVLVYTGVISRLPLYLEQLPFNAYVVFTIIFLFGTLIAGAQAIIALALPLAFTTIPEGGVPLLVLLLSMSYISMQICPTHICLTIVTEKFKIPFLELISKTLPIFLSFSVITFIYTYLLTIFL